MNSPRWAGDRKPELFLGRKTLSTESASFLYEKRETAKHDEEESANDKCCMQRGSQPQEDVSCSWNKNPWHTNKVQTRRPIFIDKRVIVALECK